MVGSLQAPICGTKCDLIEEIMVDWMNCYQRYEATPMSRDDYQKYCKENYENGSE